MNCADVRKLLYPLPGKCALTIETGRAMEHLRECAACRDYFAAQSEWVRLLREKVGTEPALEPLRERIATQIERQRAARFPGRPWVRRWGKIVAVALIVVALPAGWVAYRFPSQQFFQALCEDHVRYLDAESQVRSSDPAALEAWFREKVDFGVRVPTFDSAELRGARLCFLRQRKAALVFYRKRGKAVSLFQFNAGGISLRALDRAEIDGVPLWRMSYKGDSLAAFEYRGVIYALVSVLPESELLEWASAAQVKSRGY